MSAFSPIAIVGQGCVLPGASTPGQLWELVLSGRSALSPATDAEWHLAPDVDRSQLAREVANPAGGYVRGFERIFDPRGFAPEAGPLDDLDPVFLWTLHAAREALRSAGVADGTRHPRGALVLGNLSYPVPALVDLALETWGDAARRRDPRNRFMSGLPAQLAATALGLGAGGFALDAACASSLYAIRLACDRLNDGVCDLALAGGVNHADALFLHLGFTALAAESPTGQSRPFHRGADGLVAAHGAAIVALKRLDDAEEAGDRILGVIRGVGLSNDGRGRGLLVPMEAGQIRAMRAAYTMSGLSPRDISLVECHATGTPVGDRTEVRSMRAVFEGATDLPIGSLKSNLGHLITASGAAALLKVLAAMEAGVRPPTLHVEEPIDELATGPLRLLREPEPWTCEGPRRAAISNFGFGGNNAHLVVEAWTPRAAGSRLPPRPTRAPEEIAVVAQAVCAGSWADAARFERGLFEDADPARARAGDFDLDAARLRFPPADLKEALPQQTLLLRAALDLGDALTDLDPARTGLVVGMQCDAEVARCSLRWRAPGASGGRATEGPLSPALVLGCMPNIVANRLGSQLGLEQPTFTVSADEASGPVALDLALRSLREGEVDAAIVGAVDLSCEPVEAAAARILPEGRRVPGDAAVLMVLKRLADARRDGDPILAVLTSPGADGLGLGLDARAAGLAPLVGHAHAAAGLVTLAGAVAACARRALPRRAGRPAMPWLPAAGTRHARVPVDSFAGLRTAHDLRSDAPPPARAATGARLAVFAADTAEDLQRALARGAATQGGAYRVAIVARSDDELQARTTRAASLLAERRGDLPATLDDGIHFGRGPMLGELAFVFTGPAGAYPHMGRDLGLALPELVDALGARMHTLRDAAGWLYDQDPGYRASPEEKLWGSSFLIQLHAELTRGLLAIRPHAAIGYCSGETNALFAMGAWDDLDGFRRAIDDAAIYTRELSGELHCVRRAWRLGEGEAVGWSAMRVRAPLEDVRRAVEAEPRVHLTIINAPSDVVIAGDPEGCARVASRVGPQRARTLDYDFVMHCPEARDHAAAWRALHHRPTAEVPGVRFYTHATLSSYAPTADAAADALTGQAMNVVDFPALIQRAYADGVRVFVEHGPHGGCTRWIDEVLGDRPHVAVALDRFGSSSILEATDAVARLIAAGVPMDHPRLTARLRGPTDPPPERAAAPRKATLMRFPSHLDPVQLRVAPPEEPAQVMAPAPELPLDIDPAPPSTPSPAGDAPAVPRPRDAAPLAAAAIAAASTHQAQLAELHLAYLRHQATAHAEFLRVVFGARPAATVAAPALAPQGPAAPSPASSPTRPPPPPPAALLPPPSPPSPPAALLPPPSPPLPPPVLLAPPERKAPLITTRPGPRPPTGPSFDRAQLEVLASGTISTVFGERFQRQDAYARQVRMPEPPLLLADRVLGIEGAPGEMGLGTIWTETDVTADAWYLHEGRMPAGILVESGQADLLLISWLGIDFHNRGERVYRLLGCELTSHGELPRAGDTLRYEIHVDGHARQGDVRLFFFHYDCWVNGELRVTVRNGQAGFFTDQELADSAGVLFDPAEAKPTAKERARLDPPVARCAKRSFTAADIDAFVAGDGHACFGPGFERLATHTRTPAMQGGRMRLLDEVTELDPAGGPWGRGYLRARLALRPDHWFFAGHFKNDPCMPGTLMFEGCLQALSIYLGALGYTIECDGWRFEPVPDHAYHLRCRGQALPSSQEVVYEVFVDEIVAGPYPTIYADLLGSVDGLKAFHCRRMGLRLVPAWPMDAGRLAVDVPADRGEVARAGAFAFGYRALLACALGRPSEAFGELYAPFDGTRRVARLPSPPYHFMSRVVRVEGPIGGMKLGSLAEVAYDVPPDAWYFAENPARVMPYAVLLEVALQPCGWLASYIGSARTTDIDLVFRNLDGSGTVHREVPPHVGTLTTTTTLSSLSTAGGLIIVGFKVVVRAGDELVYTFDTVFGFFTKETMKSQVGLPTTPESRALLTAPSDVHIDLSDAPAPFFGGTLRLADPMLRMIDRITGLWPAGGKAGKGRVRAEKDVDPGEWFFKAHFFQDPVQPGSLGLEALLQALQALMIARGLGEGLTAPRFEPIAAGRAMTWKYRGQVVPENAVVVSDLDVTDSGVDERGPFVVADGSLWVDGKRIYEVRGLAMRVVPGDATPPRAFDRARIRAFWREVTGASGGWAGEDLLFALLDAFVGEVHLEDAEGLALRRGEPALYLANHQVAVETILAAIVLGGVTGTVPTLPAKAEHRHTWVGESLRRLTARPGLRDPDLLRFIDRADPTSVLRLRDDLLADFRAGRSALVHVEGTRARSCRERVTTMSSVFLDLAIAAGVDVVPVRFVGGLPIAPSAERLEIPIGHGKQDLWIGRPIPTTELAALPFAERTQRVLAAINALGVAPEAESPAPPAPELSARIAAWRAAHRVPEPQAAMAVALAALADPSDEGRALLDELRAGAPTRDPSPLGAWRSALCAWLLGQGEVAAPRPPA